MLHKILNAVSINDSFTSARLKISPTNGIQTTVLNKERTMMGNVVCSSMPDNFKCKAPIHIAVYNIRNIINSLKVMDEKKSTIEFENDSTGRAVFLVIKEGRKKAKFALKNLELPEYKDHVYIESKDIVDFSLTILEKDIKELKSMSGLVDKQEYVHMVYDGEFHVIFSTDYKKVQDSAHLTLPHGGVDVGFSFSLKLNLKHFMSVLNNAVGNLQLNFVFSKNFVEIVGVNDYITQRYILMAFK